MVIIDKNCELFLKETVKAFVKKRKELNITQKGASEKSSFTQSALSRYENGANKNIQLSTFFLFCKSLGINPAEVLEVAFAKTEGVKKKKLTIRKIGRKISTLDEERKESFLEIADQLADIAMN